MAHDRSRRPPRHYQDLENHAAPPRSPLGPSSPLSPDTYHDHPSTNATPVGELGRKKSLTVSNRMRMDPSHPNYHYRQHAQQPGVEVYPSTTGRDPIVEDTELTSHTSSETNDLKNPDFSVGEVPPQRKRSHRRRDGEKEPHQSTRRLSQEARALAKKKEREAAKPISAWTVYCNVVTFWAPGAILKCFGMPTKPQQSAWREKMGLISVILCIAAFVGFLTFGFTQVVCGSPTQRLRANNVEPGYLIIHGRAYNMVGSKHPAVRGIPKNANVLYDLPTKYGGMDASFMFQNVNGQCKGLITPAPKSGVPTNKDGDMGWYFPCKAILQDGSSEPNTTVNPLEYYGYACHTSAISREAYTSLRVQGDVYYTWDDIKNKSRNLVVYSGNVIDLDLLQWFNRSDVTVPAVFDKMREDPKLHGVDITHKYQTPTEKKIAKCLSEIARVGSIDTETVGCIASKVVLYVSLVFIVSIVAIKFVLALFFAWFLSWRLGSTLTKNGKQRRDEIEDWADDINRPAPKLQDPAIPDRRTKRQSFLPATSRFTSPYHQERPQGKGRTIPTTMASQSTNQNSRLLSPGGLYSQGNGSRGSLSNLDSGLNSSYLGENRASAIYSDEGPGPAGFIHEAVVPQPPADYQPFGYPLAHTMCLVTCYSEGEQGIRTTLDSVATTDYPNSHKLMIIICDGLIKGSGETMTTPDIILGMMKDHAVPPEYVRSFSYVAVASGSKRHNMAKVYAGFYDYGDNSMVPLEKQQRVPVLLIVKCGTPEEGSSKKPGNRGKRDSQIILMSFLQKVMFDERMTELEFEMFNGIWKITGISPDYYETVLMVDADTKVFPDSLTHMVGAMVHDPEIMGLCGETKIANKRASFVSMIQVFEYFISHHQTKAFESVFGGVTCLPGCFCMYRIKAPKGGQNYWVPILANPDVVEHYSENIVETLHDKNLLLLGEDRYLSTLMLRTFPKRKQIFVPQAVCKTVVPEEFKVLLSQRRRWINSTVHNLMELVLVRDLCGTFCFSMQFVVFIELVGTVVLPAAIAFTLYLIIISTYTRPVPVIPLILLGLILGLPAILIVLTAHRASYILWMLVYLISLPIWNFILPVYAFWKFDDFSWGDTRKVEGEVKKGHDEDEGLFDSSMIVMKRWGDFEKERRLKAPQSAWAPDARSAQWNANSTPPPASASYAPSTGVYSQPQQQYPPMPPMPQGQPWQQQGHQHHFSTSDGAATEYGI